MSLVALSARMQVSSIVLCKASQPLSQFNHGSLRIECTQNSKKEKKQPKTHYYLNLEDDVVKAGKTLQKPTDDVCMVWLYGFLGSMP